MDSLGSIRLTCMSINVTCPTCQRGLVVAPAAVGKTGRCPHCGTQFKLSVSVQPATPAASGEDPALAAFLQGRAATPAAAVAPDRPARPRRPATSRPFVVAASFLVVVAALGLWAFNASRAVKNFHAAVGVAPASTTNRVTLDNFYRIQTGMTYPEVVRILGTQRVLMSQHELDVPNLGGGQSQVSSRDTRMHMWRDSGLGTMNAVFQNGRLINKAQFGLQ